MRRRLIWPCRNTNCRKQTAETCLVCGAPCCHYCYAHGYPHGRARKTNERVEGRFGPEWKMRWVECNGAASMAAGGLR